MDKSSMWLRIKVLTARAERELSRDPYSNFCWELGINVFNTLFDDIVTVSPEAMGQGGELMGYPIKLISEGDTIKMWKEVLG